MNEGFRQAVTSWMKENVLSEAPEITEISAQSLDWVGDTQAGFHSEFEMAISYTQEGRNLVYQVSVDEMESLWNYVMNYEEPS